MNSLRWSRCWSRSVAPTRLTCQFHARPHVTLGRQWSERPPTVSIPSFRPVICRSYQHLASQPPKKTSDETSKLPNATTPKPSPEDAVHVSIAEQRKKDWNIVKRLSRNLWPKDDWSTRSRVILGVGLLVAGKVSERSVYIL